MKYGTGGWTVHQSEIAGVLCLKLLNPLNTKLQTTNFYLPSCLWIFCIFNIAARHQAGPGLAHVFSQPWCIYLLLSCKKKHNKIEGALLEGRRSVSA
jgi:hypothetical protein